MQPTVPAARGEVSAALIEALTSDGHLPVVLADMDPYGEDLHLALHVCYELHYRGFAGVSDDWEWDPGLLSVRRDLERQFLEALRRDVGGGTDVAGEFDELLVLPADGEGLSGYLAQEAERWQLEEYFALRSIYHLKEADPHVWVIPRLQGQPKAALVAVEYDEFGGGRAENLHAKLYADLLDGAGLSSEYLHYQDQAPAAMLAVVNLMSMFGLHRSLRGALVGHFAAAEISTAPSAKNIVTALQRFDADERCVRFYTEHIEADAVHEQVMRHDVVDALLKDEPDLAADVVLGIQATELVEARFGEHVLQAWRAGESALLPT